MNINGVNISSGGGGSATDFTSWTVGTRPDGSTLSEGDFVVNTAHGRGYRWDATVGALLPIDVYGETFVTSMKIVGNESSDSDINANGLINGSDTGGTITYNGTSLTVSGGSSSGQTARLRSSTVNSELMTSTRNAYCRIIASEDATPGSGGWSYDIGIIGDNVNRFRMLKSNNNVMQRTNDSLNPLVTSITADAPFEDANTYAIEMYVKRDSDEDVAHCIVDGNAYHLSAFNAHSATGYFAYFVRAVPNVDLTVYESVMCIW